MTINFDLVASDFESDMKQTEKKKKKPKLKSKENYPAGTRTYNIRMQSSEFFPKQQ